MTPAALIASSAVGFESDSATFATFAAMAFTFFVGTETTHPKTKGRDEIHYANTTTTTITTAVTQPLPQQKARTENKTTNNKHKSPKQQQQPTTTTTTNETRTSSLTLCLGDFYITRTIADSLYTPSTGFETCVTTRADVPYRHTSTQGFCHTSMRTIRAALPL